MSCCFWPMGHVDPGPLWSTDPGLNGSVHWQDGVFGSADSPPSPEPTVQADRRLCQHPSLHASAPQTLHETSMHLSVCQCPAEEPAIDFGSRSGIGRGVSPAPGGRGEKLSRQPRGDRAGRVNQDKGSSLDTAPTPVTPSQQKP
ncbi:hypothetical protein AAFF_G00416520 [Aldrovandia affinis]|uniref:Uncharacterized protein n=1 Tax=Aldrovandia affinis TaxID=143900 RepID=A0AAD7WJI4_9TELE|nr:hypothetical protein AAFF_G00416520 [Aldrovandia affinis]